MYVEGRNFPAPVSSHTPREWTEKNACHCADDPLEQQFMYQSGFEKTLMLRNVIAVALAGGMNAHLES